MRKAPFIGVIATLPLLAFAGYAAANDHDTKEPGALRRPRRNRLDAPRLGLEGEPPRHARGLEP
jgi:hypothetical protein